MTDRQKAMVESFKQHESDEPDASTERLIEMVCADFKTEASDVVEALISSKEWKELKT